MKHQTGPWGDQGNGTYINPVLYADYSDPDVIRVTQTEGANQFYFSTDNKTFQAFGQPFAVHNGYWKGPKLGLYSYYGIKYGGIAKFDWFRYNYSGLQNQKN